MMMMIISKYEYGTVQISHCHVAVSDSLQQLSEFTKFNAWIPNQDTVLQWHYGWLKLESTQTRVRCPVVLQHPAFLYMNNIQKLSYRRHSARCHSRSLKVIRCCANRRDIYEFLLALSSNLTSIFNHSWDITLSLHIYTPPLFQMKLEKTAEGRCTCITDWFKFFSKHWISNHKLTSALTCTVWSQCTPVPDRRTNIKTIARRFVLTNASRAKITHNGGLSKVHKPAELQVQLQLQLQLRSLHL